MRNSVDSCGELWDSGRVPVQYVHWPRSVDPLNGEWAAERVGGDQRIFPIVRYARAPLYVSAIDGSTARIAIAALAGRPEERALHGELVDRDLAGFKEL
jgi:hypothetical protein